MFPKPSSSLHAAFLAVFPWTLINFGDTKLNAICVMGMLSFQLACRWSLAVLTSKLIDTRFTAPKPIGKWARWYVLGRLHRELKAKATSIWIVEQFGFAMMCGCGTHLIASTLGSLPGWRQWNIVFVAELRCVIDNDHTFIRSNWSFHCSRSRHQQRKMRYELETNRVPHGVLHLYPSYH